jgi:hypothetical protein
MSKTSKRGKRPVDFGDWVIFAALALGFGMLFGMLWVLVEILVRYWDVL